MQRFSATEIRNTPSEALHQATIEPVLLTADSQPSYVIMSIDNYEHLLDRLARLEDLELGRVDSGEYRIIYRFDSDDFNPSLVTSNSAIDTAAPLN